MNKVFNFRNLAIVILLALALAAYAFRDTLTSFSARAQEVPSVQVDEIADPANADPDEVQPDSENPEEKSAGVCYTANNDTHAGQDIVCEPAERMTANVEIAYNHYNPVWDYLEYGEQTDLGFNPSSSVTFYFEHAGEHYVHEIDLDPAHMRALIKTFPSYVTYKKDGYKITATVARGHVFDVVSIQNAKGVQVWNPSMEAAPRPLNRYEIWAIEYATSKGYEWLLSDWFDTFPACAAPGSNTPNNTVVCSEPRWSPAEEYARAQAFLNYVSDPSNNVFVQMWGAVDARYRWVDRDSGAVLECLDTEADLWELPESGWLELQIGHGGTYAEPESWESTLTMKVSPGFVVGIDQAGYIFETGPSGWVLTDDNFSALRTEEWSEDKIMEALGDAADK